VISDKPSWAHSVYASGDDVYVSFAEWGADSGGKTDTCAVTVTASSGPATVYVAGNVGIRTSDDSRAMLWINGSPQQLSSTVSYANSVCVAGGNVYVAGWTGHYDDAPGDRRATLWTNGVPTQLSDTLSSAYSVFVSSGNVYVAGTVGNYGTGSARATLWTNGNAQQLSAGLSMAESVYVSGGVVYVAGSGSPSDKALYWRNGVATQLGAGAGMVGAICVSGDTVYAAGSEVVSNTSQPATLWTNGSGQRFNSDLHYGYFEGIFVSGGSLYGAGAVSNMSVPDDLKGRAFLLSNGTAQVISDKPSWAHSVYASGDDVYVSFAEWGADSGSERAMLWKNGIATQLSNSASDARCVFVAQ
jgi:hypothetical protein